MKSLLKTLVETYAPSGFEEAVRKVVAAEVAPYADEIRADAMGNLIVRKKPTTKSPASKRIMLAAHMDEIGVVVSYIDRHGFARFTNVGGAFSKYTLGARVRFMNGVSGVIAYDRFENMDGAIPLNKMYIDLGANSRDDCPVQIGDFGAFERSYMELGNRIVAKSLDDRAGVAVLIETLKAIKTTPHDLYFAFTVQEEVGVRGAGPAAYGIDPEIGIAVDVTGTGDTPASVKMAMELGKGPCVKFRDLGSLSDPRLTDWMIRVAEKAKIPYQREVLLFGGTDARAIQISRAGVIAGTLSIPCRYVHSASEMVDYGDLQNSVKLLAAMLSKSTEF